MSVRSAGWRSLLLVVGLVLGLGPAARAADPLPPRAELAAAMARDPIRLGTWAKWRERLADWLDEPAERTAPLYDSARKYLKATAGDKVKMPKLLEKDALAWYLLGNAYWRDATADLDTSENLKRADRALTKSVQLDRTNAHAHFNRAQVLLRIEDVRKPGGHNGGRLDTIRKELAAARKLKPALTIPAWDEGMLLYRLKDYPAAEKLLRQAMAEAPGKVEVAQYVARCVVMPKDRRGKRAEAVRELVAQFPRDSILAAIQARALAMDGAMAAAAEELKRARSLGFNPFKDKTLLSRELIQKIEREGGAPVVAKLPEPPPNPRAKPPDLKRVEPPGIPADFQALLARKSITLANWPTWSKGLRDLLPGWRADADPAFAVARAFMKQQVGGQKAKGGNARPFVLPKELDKDAIAWLMLGEAFFIDSDHATSEGAKEEAAANAEKALEQTLKERDGGRLSQAHWFLAKAILRQEFKKYPSPPTHRFDKDDHRKRITKALDHLREAHKLDSKAPKIPTVDEYHAMARAEKPNEARDLLLQAQKENPSDHNLTLDAAREIATFKDFKGKRAPLIRPMVAEFPADGRLASYYGYSLALDTHDWEGAAEEFKRARSLGVEPATVVPPNHVREIEEKAKPSFFTSWVIRPMIFFTIFYAIVMALMCVAGLMLAKYTRGVKAVELLDAPASSLVGAQGQVARSIHETRLTKFYVAILTLALVLFYFAIPFVIWGLLVILLLVLLLGLFIRRDYGSAQMHGQMLRASGGGLFAVFRALFASFGKGSFGVLKTEDDCPRLYQMLQEVAKRVDTDPVDEVYVAPGSEMCVHQEGRGPFGILGTKRRVLTIGLSTLPFLTVTELKAILAHEYAHFSHKDTFYIRFIHQVTLSIRTAMQGMEKTGGWMIYVNPFYWFFYLYYKSYSLLSSGFSRSREFLADRMACTLYGSDSFINGLTKVAADGTLFEQTMYKDVQEMLRKKKAYVNMYLAFRKGRDNEKAAKERDKLWKRILKQEASLFDSHPTIPERFEAARALPKAKKTDPTPALQLFEDPAEIEKELTDFLTEVFDYIRRMSR